MASREPLWPQTQESSRKGPERKGLVTQKGVSVYLCKQLGVANGTSRLPDHNRDQTVAGGV